MARPKKQGLDYFPLDVAYFNDEKIVAISGEFMEKGELAAIHLLCAVYSNGYFAEWTDLLKFKLSRELPGTTPNLLQQIVDRLVKWGFFDEGLYRKHGVLTSKAIQERFFEATRRRMKKLPSLPYILVSDAKTGDNVDNNAVIVDINPPKESKVKEIKKKNKPYEGLSKEGSPPRNGFKGFSLEDVKSVAGLPDVAALYPTAADAANFHSYYAARGWMIGGVPMASLKDAFVSWLRRRADFKSDRDNAAAGRAERERAERESLRDGGSDDSPRMVGDELDAFIKGHLARLNRKSDG